MTNSRRLQQENNEFERQLRRRQAAERRDDLARERGKTYLFHLGMTDGGTKESVEELNEILGPVGVHLELSDQSFQSMDFRYLEITVRKENVRNIRTRHAGRPENTVIYQDPETGLDTYATINKVEALIDAHGAIGAAAILGMSKAGMYRRLGRSRDAARPCDPSDQPVGENDIKF